MRELAVLDTSIASENLGDKIIMDYCGQILETLFPKVFTAAFPTHDILGRLSKEKINNSDLAIVCGTNLLSANMNKYNQWKINMKDANYLSNVCLLGVGWWQYQQEPNRYTKKLLKKILDNSYLHSVRDSYTEKQLKSMNIENVVNTACPTMWNLKKDHCQKIPQQRADEVITTLTSYGKNRKKDKLMLEILCNNYKKVYLWLQASEDSDYLQELEMQTSIETISPNLNHYDQLLQEKNVDYVGTRLHAGIRALNNRRRSLIVAIDNRALEIAKDTNLPIIKREELDQQIERKINSEWKTEIILPEDNIRKWKQQFTR